MPEDSFKVSKGRQEFSGRFATTISGVDGIIKGSPKHYDITGASGKNNRHWFCATCGSSLYTQLDVMPGKVVIKAGGLDNGKAALDGKVGVEFYCRDRVPYLASAEGAKQVPEFG